MAKVKLRRNNASAADLDEEQALAAAVKALKEEANAEKAATAAISAWVVERAKIALKFNHPTVVAIHVPDIALRGLIEVALPHIGKALAEAKTPPDKPFFELSKDEIVEALYAAFYTIKRVEFQGRFGSECPFDDPILEHEEFTF